MPWRCSACTVENVNDEFLSCSLCLCPRHPQKSDDFNDKPLSPNRVDTPSSPLPKKQLLLPLVNRKHLNGNSAPSSSSFSALAPVRTAPKSKEFERIFESHMIAKNAFSDTMFNATVKSLDGTNPGQMNARVPNCHCGNNAAVKRIGKPGPNQGQPYFTCSNAADPQSRCNFFRMTTIDSIRSHEPYLNFAWKRLDGKLFHPKHAPNATDVKQGGLGNCWFESALSTISNHPNLIYGLCSTTKTNRVGVYEIYLYVSGVRLGYIVDDRLPCRRISLVSGTRVKKIADTVKTRGGVVEKDELFTPAFCAAAENVLWPAIVEKAYAKAYGNYRVLTGGYVCEALYDLTGSPYEVIHLHTPRENEDELFLRLLSFVEAGFLMGLTCLINDKEQTLVGRHAYSLLDVKIIHNVVVGQQKKLTNFFGNTETKKRKIIAIDSDDDDEEVEVITKTTAKDSNNESRTVRLVKVRNPWGKKEWSGAWGAKSSEWTGKIRSLLGEESYSSSTSDGAAWIEFKDFIKGFYSVDVCKVRKGYSRFEYPFCFNEFNDHKYDQQNKPIVNFGSRVVRVLVAKSSFVDLMLVQASKRARQNDNYWYQDASVLVIRRKITNTNTNTDTNTDTNSKIDDENLAFEQVAILIGGEERITQTRDQVFLNAGWDYFFIPFSLNKDKMNDIFLVIYSGAEVREQACDDAVVSKILNDFVPLLYNSFIVKTTETNSIYEVAKPHSLCDKAVILRVRFEGVLIFIVLNDSDHNLCVDFKLDSNHSLKDFLGKAEDYNFKVRNNDKKKCLVRRQTMKIISWNRIVTDQFTAEYRYSCVKADEEAKDRDIFLGTGRITKSSIEAINCCESFGKGEFEKDGFGQTDGFYGSTDMLQGRLVQTRITR